MNNQNDQIEFIELKEWICPLCGAHKHYLGQGFIDCIGCGAHIETSTPLRRSVYAAQAAIARDGSVEVAGVVCVMVPVGWLQCVENNLKSAGENIESALNWLSNNMLQAATPPEGEEKP